MTDTRLSIAKTPKGNLVRFWTRPHVNDEALVVGILGGDEYRLAELPDDLDGWALDIGAHVGTVGIALAVDHPRLRVVMVEPIPDNAELCRQSAELNGVSDRVTVIEAMAGYGQGTATCRWDYRSLEGFADPGFVTQNAYVGNIWRLTDDEKVDSEVAEIAIVTAWDIAADHLLSDPSGAWALVKTDCEGCEWEFLKGATPEMMPLIVGEWHDGPIENMKALLKGYDVTVLDDYGGSGIFRAVAK
jgi:FkbM family methyltransferase